MRPFERGERVRINDGPFMNFTGVVTDVKADRRTLTVSVTVFSRSNVIELRFTQVQKIA
jgi:transcriptional antiterminator NusG